jgi:hypothetical protein
MRWSDLPSHNASDAAHGPQKTMPFGPPMDRALSFLISAAIAAFGVWTASYTIASGLPSSWTLMGLLEIIIGSISLHQAIGEARLVR